MKRERRIAVILATLATTVLCGCGGASAIAFSNEEAAKDALNTAGTVHFDGDVKAVNQGTDIQADGQVAGYMEETGFFDTKWTVSIDGNTWFYAKFVTDEPINENTDTIVSATTYGFYDADDTCIGYAQEQAVKGGSGGYYICYMDADGNPKDYYSNEKATQTYDSEGNLIATGTVDFNGFFESQHCYVEITAEEGSTMQMDFMDKMAMYLYLFSDFNSEHLD